MIPCPELKPGRLAASRTDARGTDRQTRAAKGALESPAVKTFDAIHLASAAQLGSALTQFVTYDQGLRAAAAEVGMRVVTPR